MTRTLAVLAMLAGSTTAFAEDEPLEVSAESSIADDVGDQGVGAEVGIATGGRVTPGGLRVAGHYLYQLTETDWFDGRASFTFGGGDAACFVDEMDAMSCDHGLADGSGVEISASVRRMFGTHGAFRPFVRAGVGIGIVRFSDDEVTGLAIPLRGGGGVRVRVTPDVAVVAEAEVGLGIGAFNRGLGAEPLLGGSVTAGAEFRLR
ncbi:MAG: hypothetical protein AB7O24_23850 [Kofleriaceae bacterium]